MEFENLLDGILLIMKKRYCAYASESLNKDFSLYVKGLEIKRRDNALFVKKLWEETLEILLKEKQPKKALEHVKTFLKKLLRGELPKDQFVITQALTRNIDEYAAAGPHVTVASKMRERDPNNAPQCGDRVEYIVYKGAKGSKVCDRAEDPKFADILDIEIDYYYYAERQVVKPFMRLFQPMWDSDMIQRNKLLTMDEMTHYEEEKEDNASINPFPEMMASGSRSMFVNEKSTISYLFGSVLNSHDMHQQEVEKKVKQSKRKRGPLDRWVVPASSLVSITNEKPIAKRRTKQAHKRRTKKARKRKVQGPHVKVEIKNERAY